MWCAADRNLLTACDKLLITTGTSTQPISINSSSTFNDVYEWQLKKYEHWLPWKSKEFEVNGLLGVYMRKVWCLGLLHKNQSCKLSVSTISPYLCSHLNITNLFVLTCHFSHVIIICYEVALYADRHLLSLMNRAAVIAYQDEILNHGKLKLKLNFTAYVIQANFKTLYPLLWVTMLSQYGIVIKYSTAYMD